MRILIVEPYLAGSHKSWAEGYRAHSRHDVEIIGLSGSSWKWRMHGGAVTLARRYLELEADPDLIIATDMLDVTTFQSLTRSRIASELKPPKMTEWMAPIRAHANMTTVSSGTMGR